MSILFDLPEDLSYLIIANWLELVHYGYLDAAISGEKDVWFRLLKKLPKLYVGRGTHSRMPMRLSRWCYAREISLFDVSISDFWFNKNGHLKCKAHWKDVEELNIICTKKKYLNKIDDQIAPQCTSIKSLSVLSVYAVLVSRFDVLNRLTSLSFVQKDSKMASMALEKIAFHCRLLCHLALDFKDMRIFTEQCTAIVDVNPGLRSIKVPAELLIASSLIQRCNGLETVRLWSLLQDLPHFQALCSLPHVTRVDAGFCHYLVVGRSKYLTVHLDDSMVGFDAFVSSLREYSSLRIGCSIFSLDNVRTVLQQSVNTLEELQLPNLNVNSSVVTNAVIQCSRLTSLYWDEANGNLFDLSRSNLQLKKLNYNERRLTLVKVIAIIHCFPHLENCIFRLVLERMEDIMAFKDFMYIYGVGHPTFMCDLRLESFYSLRYKNGRFGGTSVDQYLSAVETDLMANNSDPWYILGDFGL